MKTRPDFRFCYPPTVYGIYDTGDGTIYIFGEHDDRFENKIEVVISHETDHWVIQKVAGKQASLALDNIPPELLRIYEKAVIQKKLMFFYPTKPQIVNRKNMINEKLIAYLPSERCTIDKKNVEKKKPKPSYLALNVSNNSKQKEISEFFNTR